MVQPERHRSRGIGLFFLGVAAVLTVLTVTVAITDRPVADLFELAPGRSDNPSSNEHDQTTEATLKQPPEYIPDRIPSDTQLSARSALVIHLNSGTVLFERNADEEVQPASTAKIITALTVLEHASPTEVIEIRSEDVVDPVAESSMGLQAGDKVTVHDLIVGLMLPSGNDAAHALARTIGERIATSDGETAEERFISAMNRTVEQAGMEHTVLLHPAGHDREGQHVTARDLAIAAEALLERKSLVPIVAMKRAEVRVGGDHARVLVVDNTNLLLVHDGVFGVKTGTTTEAGQALVVAYRDGEQIILVILLGSENRYQDARTLLGLDPPPVQDDDQDDAGEPESST